MTVLVYALRGLMALNTLVLAVAKRLGWFALALMVFIMLLQVFFRYGMGNALAWPDEAARFLMLWMTGLMAPAAYRHGGFVAIDLVPRALPPMFSALLKLTLLAMAMLVLIVALPHAWKHTMGFGGNFSSASLVLPLEYLPVDWFGTENVKLKLRYMYMSLLVGVVILISITLELILRAIVDLFSPSQSIAPPPDPDLMAAD